MAKYITGQEILNFIIGIWMLVAMVIAVRQALDYESTWRAVGVCLIGWIVQIAIFALFFWLVGWLGDSELHRHNSFKKHNYATPL